ncbi:hypothetical protein ACFV1N_38005 [Streptosporangium canum]
MSNGSRLETLLIPLGARAGRPLNDVAPLRIRYKMHVLGIARLDPPVEVV